MGEHTDKHGFDNINDLHHRVRRFDEIKHDPFILQNILWDVQPKDLMEPRLLPETKDKERLKGYVFYIETANDIPSLFLMRHSAAGYAETLAVVNNIPIDLLKDAIEENKDKEFFMMYPINSAIKNWLLKHITTPDE